VPEQPDRLPLDAVVHHETYRDYTADLIDDLYRAKDAREDNLQFIAENGKKTLAQVFTDVRYKKTDNEYFSGKFLDVIRKQGFLSR
ncbi:MAG: NADPH-dependent oxidoreductase, partial [Actinomycetota bacterium]